MSKHEPEPTNDKTDLSANVGVSRRQWLTQAGALGAGALLAARSTSAMSQPPGKAKKKQEEEEEDVSPPEDLMREHGVLKRVLLVYGEAIRRLDAHQELPPEAVRDGAEIIRNFIENYHEKLEEDYLFPRFEKAGRLTDLTKVLRAQHQAGRRLTDEITGLATLATLKDPKPSATLREALHSFIRMYEPHEAREDTVLFPALRDIVSRHELGALGEDFEKKEHTLFGEDGFEKMVDRVAGVEKTLGIYDLAQFTPKV
jgi:hemerythrin-like domain-containing protein